MPLWTDLASILSGRQHLRLQVCLPCIPGRAALPHNYKCLHTSHVSYWGIKLIQLFFLSEPDELKWTVSPHVPEGSREIVASTMQIGPIEKQTRARAGPHFIPIMPIVEHQQQMFLEVTPDPHKHMQHLLLRRLYPGFYKTDLTDWYQLARLPCQIGNRPF